MLAKFNLAKIPMPRLRIPLNLNAILFSLDGCVPLFGKKSH
jgi:hypothetical protein